MGLWWLLPLGLAWAAPEDGVCPGCRVDDGEGWHLVGDQLVGPDGIALRFEGEVAPMDGPLTVGDVNVERGKLAAELEARGLKLGEAGGRIVTTALGEPTVVIEGQIVKTRKFDKLNPGQTAPKAIARITRRCVGAVRVSAEGDAVDVGQLTHAASEILWADPSCERYNARSYHQVSAASVAATEALPLAPIPPAPEGTSRWPFLLLGLAGVGGGAALWWRKRAGETSAPAVPRAGGPKGQQVPFRPRELAGPVPEIQSVGWGAGPVFRPGESSAADAVPSPTPEPRPTAAPVPTPAPTPPPPAPPEAPMLELKPPPAAILRPMSLSFAASSPPEPPMLPDASGPVFRPKVVPDEGASAPVDPMVAAVAALGQQVGLDRSPPSAGQATKVPAPYAAFLETCDGASWGSGWLRLLGAREGRGLTVQSLNAGLAGRIGRRFALGFFGDGSLVVLTPRGEVVVGFPDGRPSRSAGPNLTAFLTSLSRDPEMRVGLCDPQMLIRVQRLLGPLGPDQVFDWGTEPPRKTFILARWEGASML